MEMNPQRVRSAEFRTVKKGLDPNEVQSFLRSVADELEKAQNQATAMEARARAAVARLQEISQASPSDGDDSSSAQAASTDADSSSTSASSTKVSASVDESETISRTLLLAQRTADTTVAEAQAEAERLRSEAAAEVLDQRESARERAESLIADARAAARLAGDEERAAVEGEVNSLLARRDFLESDVDHLERFLVDQRTRLREAAREIVEVTDRIPGGLGEVRRPLLSAVADDADVGGDTDVSGAAGESTAPDTDGDTAADPTAVSGGAAGVVGDADTDGDDTMGIEMPVDSSAAEADADGVIEELWLPDDDVEPMPVIDTERPDNT